MRKLLFSQALLQLLFIFFECNLCFAQQVFDIFSYINDHKPLNQSLLDFQRQYKLPGIYYIANSNVSNDAFCIVNDTDLLIITYHNVEGQYYGRFSPKGTIGRLWISKNIKISNFAEFKNIVHKSSLGSLFKDSDFKIISSPGKTIFRAYSKHNGWRITVEYLDDRMESKTYHYADWQSFHTILERDG
mgnify:CR=1 FL=1